MSGDRLRFAIAAAVASLAIGGCAQTQLAATAVKSVQAEPSAQPAATYKVGAPYQIAGVWYYPAENFSYDETGIASWYGTEFHGRATANGERYDMNSLTAAHQTLPLPTIVRVTNLENGRAMKLRINDRGPFVRGRIVDLSRLGAQLLGFEQKGTAKVRVEVLSEESLSLKLALLRGQQQDQPTAVAAAPRHAVQAEALAPPPGYAAARPPAPAKPVVVVASAPIMPVAIEPTAPVVTQQPVRPTAIYIQAGAFANFDNANRLRARLSTLGPVKVMQADARGLTLFRVRLGPVSSVEEADRLLERVGAAGYPEARVVVD